VVTHSESSQRPKKKIREEKRPTRKEEWKEVAERREGQEFEKKSQGVLSGYEPADGGKGIHPLKRRRRRT